jgi:hypothetical protein
LWEGKLEFIGYYFMVDSYERELYSACVSEVVGSSVAGVVAL